jgi:hypothetical protein
LNDAHSLVVFSDPDAVRRYLLEANRRPVAILLNGQREGALSLMSWINSAIDTPVIYFGPRQAFRIFIIWTRSRNR